MTVMELIETLNQFDPDMEIIIGMHQRFGSNFAKEIRSVSVEPINTFYGDDTSCVVITEGEQLGTVDY